MEGKVLSKAAAFFAEQRRRKRWFRAVSAMAAVVVFCTTYALILPAITLDNQPICGLEEHVHTDDCYTLKTVFPAPEFLCTENPAGHIHDEDCYNEDGELICGYADFVVHTHDENCYDESGELVCPLSEIEEHQHNEDCYRERQVLTCGQEETGHIHSGSCYAYRRGDLICEQEESGGHTHGSGCYETGREMVCDLEENEDHTHDDSCYREWEELTCDLEESAGHTHGDNCYDWEQELVCGREEAGGHIHDESCYTTERELVCDQEEITLHTHDEDCFDTEDCPLCAEENPPEHTHPLICGQLQVLEHRHSDACILLPEGEPEVVRVLTCGLEEHTHTDACYELQSQQPETEEPVYLCGLAEHTHDETCYDEAGELICGLAEHTHDETCLTPAEEVLRVLTYEGADYTVTVSFGDDAALPEGVTLSVEEIVPDSEAYQSYRQQALDTLTAQRTEGAERLLFARFFDMQFLLDGQVLEPAAPVSVTITYAEEVETGEDVSCQTIHFAEDGPELLTAETESPEEGTTSFTHVQESFSVVGNVVAQHMENAADVGPDSLPVDYYVCIDGKWTCVGATKTGWWYAAATGDLTDYNRDYITVDQAKSILDKYGFTGEEANPSLITAYQQKSGHLNIYSDTNTVESDGQNILPLSRNTDHAGYNLYYLPANIEKIGGVASPEVLDKSANGFYTVTVYDAKGTILNSEIVKTGGSFTYTASETPENGWLVAYGNGSTGEISGKTISIDNITTSVTISPKKGDVGSHSVTFKVMIDGQWQKVGSLPYYYSGTVNGSRRAYITSDMAAQFLGDFGYTATTAPEYHFGYSYNDIYTLFYANGATKTNFCMDVDGGKIQEAQVVQLYTSNGTDAQTFRVWDAGNGYSFITPIGDSSFHVNVYGYSTGDPSSTQLKLSTATNENSQWKVDTGSDGRTTFWSAIAPEDQVIDLNNADMSNGGRLQIWHSTGGARYWYMVQQYRVSNDIVSSQNTDGTYKIGLTPESNGDIVCYYMPSETASTYTNVAESAVSADNSFWSVSVRDDGHAVYSEGELSNMVQYVAPGGEATVTVRNGDGVLWSVAGATEVEETQSGGYTTFVIKNITQPVEVTATRANPSFTVQYYANIPRFANSGDATLTVIDTSGKKLPTNGGSMATRNLYLEGIGQNTGQNNGNATPLYRVKTTTVLTKMYAEGTFHYEESPGLPYFNKLKDNESYALSEIWVLKAGKKADSTNRNDWTIYTYGEDTAFTNEASQAVGNTILISDGAVIRLVSDTSSGDYYNGTTFYDYNISSGQNSDGRWRTGITGINSKENYGTSSNGKRNWNSGADVLAFGNANCGTGMAHYLFDEGTLNKYNTRNSNYGGTTFGLVDSLKEDGTIQYNEWIVAPKLFNEGDAKYKQTYAGSSLTFDRVGDTYTLKSATLKNSNGQQNTLSGLQHFFNPSPSSETTHSHIYTNNFWPMDQAAGRTDALWGAYNNPGKFQGFVEGGNPTNGWSDNAADFPVGDDGRAHNWFFGMNFALSFNLTKDYVGPLEYYFFGDDDLWVFLNDKLICDIGGVHSSVGEYVNLRDYLPVGSEGQYTLSFFYTERGDTGSTCYMSFTLPSVSTATTERDTGSLQLSKTLAGDSTGLSDEEYKFTVELLTAENGSPLNQTFSYTVTDNDEATSDTYGTVKSGGSITLKAGQTATISGIPAGAFYRITEESTAGYKVTVNGKEGYILSGKIQTGEIATGAFVNTPYYELPSTGGGGTYWYTLGGLCLMAGALLLYKTRLYRKGGRDSPC